MFLIPHLSANLLSVGQLVGINCTISFSCTGKCHTESGNGEVIGTGHKSGRLFPPSLPTQLSSLYSVTLQVDNSANSGIKGGFTQ